MPRISSSGGRRFRTGHGSPPCDMGAGALENPRARRKVEEHRQRRGADRARIAAERAAHELGRAARFRRVRGQRRRAGASISVSSRPASISASSTTTGTSSTHSIERRAGASASTQSSIHSSTAGRRARDAGFEIGARFDRLAAVAQMPRERVERRARQQDVPLPGRLRRRRQAARRHRHHADIARIARHAAQTVAVDRDAAADRRAEKQIDEVVATDGRSRRTVRRSRRRCRRSR